MYDRTKYYCDKCNSHDIETRVLRREEPEPILKSMSSLAKEASSSMQTTLEYRYTTYVATCKKCGHQVKWSQ